MEVPLPHSVEQILQKICMEQQQSPPDAQARRQLASVGEDSALDILREISRIKIRNLSALINYMATKAPQGYTICFVFFFLSTFVRRGEVLGAVLLPRKTVGGRRVNKFACV